MQSYQRVVVEVILKARVGEDAKWVSFVHLRTMIEATTDDLYTGILREGEPHAHFRMQFIVMRHTIFSGLVLARMQTGAFTCGSTVAPLADRAARTCTAGSPRRTLKAVSGFVIVSGWT